MAKCELYILSLYSGRDSFEHRNKCLKETPFSRRGRIWRLITLCVSDACKKTMVFFYLIDDGKWMRVGAIDLYNSDIMFLTRCVQSRPYIKSTSKLLIDFLRGIMSNTCVIRFFDQISIIFKLSVGYWWKSNFRKLDNIVT